MILNNRVFVKLTLNIYFFHLYSFSRDSAGKEVPNSIILLEIVNMKRVA